MLLARKMRIEKIQTEKYDLALNYFEISLRSKEAVKRAKKIDEEFHNQMH